MQFFKKYWQRIFILAGLAGVTYLVVDAGPMNMIVHLQEVGWSFFFVIAAYSFCHFFDAWGWQFAFPPDDRPSVWTCFWIRIAGESINITAPGGYMGGEPVKAYLVHKHGNVSLGRGTASIVISKFIQTIAEAIFITIGVVLLFTALSDQIPEGIRSSVNWGALISTSIAIPVLILFFVFQKKGFFGMFITFFRKIGIRIKALEEREEQIREVDKEIASFYANHPGRVAISMVLFFLGWVVGALEIYLIVTLMGVPLGAVGAYVTESLALIIKGMGFFVPGTLGIHEIGHQTILHNILGLSASVGLFVGLARRIREVFFVIIGLVIIGFTGRPTSEIQLAEDTPLPEESAVTPH